MDETVREDFELFFSLPIRIELCCRSLKRVVQWHSGCSIEVLVEAREALRSVIELLEDPRLQERRLCTALVEHIQPFMAWGTNFGIGAETHRGACALMSPSLHLLHELMGTPIDSLRVRVMDRTRSSMRREDRRLLGAARCVGTRLAKEATHDEGTAMIRNQCRELLHRIRALHMRLVVHSVSVVTPSGSAATDLKTQASRLHGGRSLKQRHQAAQRSRVDFFGVSKVA